MTVQITRRRLITVAAAAAGLPLILKAGGAQARLVTWEGTTLGAPSSIKLVAADEAKARAAIAAALNELERLEAVFSVYRADSVLSTLNRDGRVDNAPADFVALLAKSLDLAMKGVDSVTGVASQTVDKSFAFAQRASSDAGSILSGALNSMSAQQEQFASALENIKAGDVRPLIYVGLGVVALVAVVLITKGKT